MHDPLQDLARQSGRYQVEAFRFLFESLDEATRLAGKEQAEGLDRHLTGQPVLEGLRAHALRVFGPLAPGVWRRWGVHVSLDWGRVVFLLVDAGLLSRRDEDRLDDFREGFDFDATFAEAYAVPLPTELRS